MRTHSSHSRLRTMALALALVLGSTLLLSGQDAKTKHGVPKDWSTHHVVFSNPGTAADAIKNGTYAHWLKVTSDPRYILQQQLRAAAAAGPSLPAPPLALGSDADGAGPDIAPPPTDGPLPRGLARALISPTGLEALPPDATKKKRIHKDWSVGEGTNGTSGLGEFPATFTGTTTSCSTDYAVYNTGLTGSTTQPSIVAFNNIYVSCTSSPHTPGTYWAFDTAGGTILNSVDLSRDGTQLAFVQSNTSGVATLVVMKWAASSGTLGLPTVLASNSSYPSCTAPCMIALTFNGSPTDTYSAPFYDYHGSNDTLYVGDDVGKLHKFHPVFGGGTPAEVTSGWPVQVSPITSPNTVGAALGSPVYDANTSLAFVGDYLLNYSSTCEPSANTVNGSCGYVYSVNSSSGTVVQSHQLDYQYGIVDSPIIDVNTQQVFAFVGADNTTSCSSGPCAGVFQFAEGFGAGTSGTEAKVGAGYEFMLSGAFDNNYFTNTTGNLYVVGGTGPQNNTLYAVGITSGTISGTVTTGPAVAANYTNGYYAGGLQVTEFYTGSVDYIFLGVLMATTNASVGQVVGYTVTTPPFGAGATLNGTIASQGGSSGIVVDSSLSGAQNIYYSSLLNVASCTNTGTGGCAVQTTQSAP